MITQIPQATNIKAENADDTRFSAEINGKRWSGICEGSTDWPSVKKAIDDGAEVEAYVEYVPTYAERRAREYPAIGDQLDAIIKELNYRRMNGENLIAEMDSIVGLCLAVKKDYPKPEGA